MSRISIQKLRKGPQKILSVEPQRFKELQKENRMPKTLSQSQGERKRSCSFHGMGRIQSHWVIGGKTKTKFVLKMEDRTGQYLEKPNADNTVRHSHFVSTKKKRPVCRVIGGSMGWVGRPCRYCCHTWGSGSKQVKEKNSSGIVFVSQRIVLFQEKRKTRLGGRGKNTRTNRLPSSLRRNGGWGGVLGYDSGRGATIKVGESYQKQPQNNLGLWGKRES